MNLKRSTLASIVGMGLIALFGCANTAAMIRQALAGDFVT